MSHSRDGFGGRRATTVIKETKIEGIEKVKFFQLFSYTNKKERALLCLATLACVGAGSLIPALDIYFGHLADVMVLLEKNRNRQARNKTCLIQHEGRFYYDREEHIYKDLKKFAIVIGGIGFCHMLCCYCYVTVFNYVAEKQSHRLKGAYLKALFRQDLSWHALHAERHDSNFVSNLLEDITRIQEATGEKLGLCLYVFFTSVFSLIFALITGPLLTLIVGAVTPVMFTVSVIVYKIESKLAHIEEREYAKADAICEEALSHIKAVIAFQGADNEMRLYQRTLKPGISASWKRAFVEALGGGVLWFLNFATYSLAFWYGSTLVLEHDLCENQDGYSTHSLMVCFNVIIAFFEICSYFPYIDVFAEGCQAAAFIFHVCKRVPEIDPYSDEGLVLDEPLKGKIQFVNVSFSFPSQPEKKVIKNLNLTIEPGTNAVVGPTGSGKSLLLSLISRSYDPTEGHILLDDEDIRNYNVKWLRSQIGVITQEPVIFNNTIAKNIKLGKENATQEEIEEVCKIALAHEFIVSLPHGYNTVCGHGGVLLSHPHRQRIAMARALISNPAILLVDEEMGPLETPNQGLVIQSLLSTRTHRTTVIIAELLQTMTSADCIISLVHGEVTEVGPSSELIGNQGFYSHLYERLSENTNSVAVDESVEAAMQKHYVSRSGSTGRIQRLATRSYSVTSALKFEFVEQLVDHDEKDTERLALKNKSAFMRILYHNRKEAHLLALGIFMAIILGCTSPLYALFFGKILGVFGWDDENMAREKAHLYSLVIFLLGFVAGFATVIQTFCFSLAGESLTTRLREKTFAAMMNQELAFYDSTEHTITTLYGSLSSDASAVQGATGVRFGSVFQAMATIIVAMTMSLYLSPVLGACTLIVAPSISIATYFSIRLIQGQQAYEKVAAEEVSKLAYEAYNHIHTVANLGKQLEFVSTFCESLEVPHKQALKLSHYLGIICGVSQSSIYFAYAFVIYMGSYEIQKQETEFEIIFTIGEALTWCMLVLGQTFAFASNFSKATVCASRIFQLLDRVPSIRPEDNADFDHAPLQGNVTLVKVDFDDPTRPGTMILSGVSLACKAGKNIAVVGTMDDGKSAIIKLILRLYDPTEGKVLIDDKNIKRWNLHHLRSQIGPIFQEPYLFRRSIAENIAYGDLSRDIPIEEILNAAKAANIHDDICDLPMGYKTILTVGSNELNRGQMQRIAIARALIRNPKLILFDDATSGVDYNSEESILRTLDAVSKGRMCISVCTKLSSVKDADKIFLIHKGVLAEEGTHEELYSRRGYYYKLWNLQNMGFQMPRTRSPMLDEDD